MKLLVSLSAAAMIVGTSAFAGGHVGSTFQNTCSNIQFAYLGNDAGITATCLRADGTPNATSIAIPGISNQNGVLTNSGGASSFQQSCGNIGFEIDINFVTMTANCRTSDGRFNESAIDINGINNSNGNLTN